MSGTAVKHAYNERFIARTVEAREHVGAAQHEVARALHIPQDQYKHFEIDRPLSQYLITDFCNFCRVNVAWFLSGEGRMPLKQAPAPASEPAKAPRRRARAKRAA
jgi:hypothetical protein